MTKKPAVPDDSFGLEPREAEAAAALPERKKEYTQPPVRGGAYAEDGTPLQEPQPEPDAHRTRKPEH